MHSETRDSGKWRSSFNRKIASIWRYGWRVHLTASVVVPKLIRYLRMLLGSSSRVGMYFGVGVRFVAASVFFFLFSVTTLDYNGSGKCKYGWLDTFVLFLLHTTFAISRDCNLIFYAALIIVCQPVFCGWRAPFDSSF